MRSKIYVVIQILLLGAIVFFGKFPPQDYVFYFVLILGFVVIIWSFVAKKMSVSIFPEPTKEMPLITSGPYQFVRHPIYFGVLLMTISLIPFSSGMYLFLLVWISLFVLFLFKIDHEERSLLNNYPEYKKYAKKTKKLIPFLY